MYCSDDVVSRGEQRMGCWFSVSKVLQQRGGWSLVSKVLRKKNVVLAG